MGVNLGNFSSAINNTFFNNSIPVQFGGFGAGNITNNTMINTYGPYVINCGYDGSPISVVVSFLFPRIVL
jgi:hypothetical protein